jgi:N-acetyl-anhydromuramyl-L-alanine amidase AmpD
MSAPRYTSKPTLLSSDRHGRAVELIVVHETAGTFPGDLNWLVGSRVVSINWFIDRSGWIYCLEEKKATAHAGPATWGKHTDPNEEVNNWGWANLASEGIEVSGPNDGTPFTDAQVSSLVDLVRWRLEVKGLPISAVVRHLDIAFPAKRKNDPRGLDWPRFLARLAPSNAPKLASIGGAGGFPYACDSTFADFYDAHGGLLTFGFATSDMYLDADTDGEQCFFMEFENAIIKLKKSMPTSWQIRPILLTEAIVRKQRKG